MLRAESAAQIAPPSSVDLRTVSAEPRDTITGPQSGFYGHLYGTTIAGEEVAAFYAGKLAGLGWKKDRPPIRGSTETKTWGWCKPRMVFRLAILDPVGYERAALKVPAEVSLVFDARIQGTNGACP